MAEHAARAYLLWGDDALTRDDVVRSFKKRMLSRPGGDLNLSEFRAPELNARELIDTCNTLPFIADRRLVIIHHLFGWHPRVASRRREPAGEDGATHPLRPVREAFLDYLPELAPQTTLVLVEGGLNSTQRTQIQERLPVRRADVRAFPAPNGYELERWLSRRAGLRGGEFATRVAGLLREHGPAGLEALDQEVAKLVTYANGRPVSVSDLDELLPGGQIAIFELLDAVAEARLADALKALRRLLAQGQRTEEITPQLIALVRRLLVCRLALEEGSDLSVVEREHSIKLIDKLKRQARSRSVEGLESGLGRLLEYDRGVKQGQVEAGSGLELLVTELASN